MANNSVSQAFAPPPPPTADPRQIYLWQTSVQKEMVTRIGLTNDRIARLISIAESQSGNGSGNGSSTGATASTDPKDGVIKRLKERQFTDINTLNKKKVDLTEDEMKFITNKIFSDKKLMSKIKFVTSVGLGALRGQDLETSKKEMLTSDIGSLLGGNGLLGKSVENGTMAKWLTEYQTETLAKDEADAIKAIETENANIKKEADFEKKLIASGVIQPKEEVSVAQSVGDAISATIPNVVGAMGVIDTTELTSYAKTIASHTYDMLDLMTGKTEPKSVEVAQTQSVSSVASGDSIDADLFKQSIVENAEWSNVIADSVSEGAEKIVTQIADFANNTIPDMVRSLRGFNETTYPTAHLSNKTMTEFGEILKRELMLDDDSGGGGGLGGLTKGIPPQMLALMAVVTATSIAVGLLAKATGEANDSKEELDKNVDSNVKQSNNLYGDLGKRLNMDDNQLKAFENSNPEKFKQIKEASLKAQQATENETRVNADVGSTWALGMDASSEDDQLIASVEAQKAQADFLKLTKENRNANKPKVVAQVASTQTPQVAETMPSTQTPQVATATGNLAGGVVTKAVEVKDPMDFTMMNLNDAQNGRLMELKRFMLAEFSKGIAEALARTYKAPSSTPKADDKTETPSASHNNEF